MEIPPGGDAIRSYRKIKRWMKEDRFIESIRDNSVYTKPSAIKREKRKQRAKTLRKLQRERDSNIFLGVQRGRGR